MKLRIHALLGADGVRRLAIALRCTPQRFHRPNIRSTVVAIVELLELLVAKGIAQENWPPRWDVAAPALARTRHDKLKARFEMFLGRKALVPRLAVVLDLGQETITAAFKGRSLGALEDLTAIAELIEATGLGSAVSVHGLPERWHQVNDALERKRSSRKAPRPPPRKCETARMKSRMEAAIGGKHPNARFARALEKSPDALGRIWRSELDHRGRRATVQPTLAAVIELIETLRAEGVPIERWPARWRQEIPGLSPSSRDKQTRYPLSSSRG